MQLLQHLNLSLYRDLIAYIISFALRKIHQHYLQLNNVTETDLLPPCIKTFTATISLLCAYKIQEYIEEDSILQR